MGLPGCHDVVPRRVLLEHEPHRLDEVAGEAPVPPRLEVAETQFLRLALLDRGHAQRDLARDEILATAGRLVVEEDAVRDVHPVSFAIVDRDPVAEDLGDPVGRPGVERGRLPLRVLLDEPEHLRAAPLLDAGLELRLAHRVEQAHHAEGRDVRGVLGHLERDFDVALRRQVVGLVGRYRLERPHEAVLIHEVAVVQHEALADVVDPPGVEGAAAPDEAVDLVALFEEELREVAAVLTGDPRDQGLLRCHWRPSRPPGQSSNLTPTPRRGSKTLEKEKGTVALRPSAAMRIRGYYRSAAPSAPRGYGRGSLRTSSGAVGAPIRSDSRGRFGAIPPPSLAGLTPGPRIRTKQRRFNAFARSRRTLGDAISCGDATLPYRSRNVRTGPCRRSAGSGAASSCGRGSSARCRGRGRWCRGCRGSRRDARGCTAARTASAPGAAAAAGPRAPACPSSAAPP